MKNLRNRNFLTLLDFTQKEMEFLLNLSEDLKRAKYAGIEQQKMKGKNIALLFEKDSTRTRCAFETAAYDQGAHVTYLGPTGSQMGKKESTKDTARVLGGMYDGIEYRGFSQRVVEDLAKYSGVPVWNGLTDEDHPTQVLVANALMQGAAIMGMTFHLVCPKELNPTDELLNRCNDIADKNGGEILITDDIDEGVKGSDVIYTDVWVSMGEPDEVWEKRIKLLEPYRVTKELMKKTGNPHTIFEHCLPSFHDTETIIGKQIQEKYGLTEMEVTNEVFESEQSVVFQEAENRAHTIKAVMVATLGE